jgi:hypothetical protein
MNNINHKHKDIKHGGCSIDFCASWWFIFIHLVSSVGALKAFLSGSSLAGQSLKRFMRFHL